jgi:Phosphoribosylformylglycinamidine (FGAM) synthase, synthetase domain
MKGLNYVQVSGNWMAASGVEQQDIALRDGVEALSKMSIDLKGSIPVGKDSLSMKTKGTDNENELEVTSPLSGVITARAPVEEITLSVTPELNLEEETTILLVKLNNKKRIAGSIFSEITESHYKETLEIDEVDKFKIMFEVIQEMIKNKKILALHDISEGGIITTFLEMCFTKKIGMKLDLNQFNNIHKELFAEEIGIAIQVKKEEEEEIKKYFKEENIYVEQIAI